MAQASNPAGSSFYSPEATRADALHPSAVEGDFISAIRLLMICGLVYHHLFEIPGSQHSPRLNLETYTQFLPDFINAFFHMAFMAAVPVLSIISGYLFFRKPVVSFSMPLQRRFYTVALPSWLWSAFWLLIAFGLYSAGLREGMFAWTNYSFADFGPLTLLNGVVGLTEQPFAFQFWFVHDLLLTLLLTPVIYLCLRIFGGFLLVPMIILWFFVQYPPVFYSSNVPVFFTIGAFLALPGGPGLERVLQQLVQYRWPLLMLFASSLVVRIMSHTLGPLEGLVNSDQYLSYLRLVGVMAIAPLVFNLVRHGRLNLFVTYSGYSFFIFAAHYPLIEFFQIGATLIPGYDTVPGMLLSWLLLPLLCIVFIVAVAEGFEKLAPGVFRLLNGGRTTSGGGRVRHRIQPQNPGIAG